MRFRRSFLHLSSWSNTWYSLERLSKINASSTWASWPLLQIHHSLIPWLNLRFWILSLLLLTIIRLSKGAKCTVIWRLYSSLLARRFYCRRRFQWFTICYSLTLLFKYFSACLLRNYNPLILLLCICCHDLLMLLKVFLLQCILSETTLITVIRSDGILRSHNSYSIH